MPIGSIEDIWAAVCEECKKTISEVAFNCFLKDLKPVSLDGGEFILSINNDYMRGVVEQNYTQVLENAIKAVMGIDIKVKIIFEDDEENILKAEQFSDGLTFEDFFTFSNFLLTRRRWRSTTTTPLPTIRLLYTDLPEWEKLICSLL